MQGRNARRRTAAVAITAFALGGGVLAALPVDGRAGPLDDLVDRLVHPVQEALTPATPAKPAPAGKATREALTPEPPALRQAEDPKTQPPLHATNPHGQGTVGVVDLSPSSDRPQGGDPAGSDSGEEVVVGRARGEQRPDGRYHGHITIAALFGNEILGVDTNPGESRAGPLDAVQQGLLTPLCNGSGNQICLSAVRADSNTTANGSSNRFSAARATIGGAQGIDVGAAESNGNISSDGTCQTSRGDSSVASAKVGGQAVADVARSSTDSRACKGQSPTQSNSSSVIALGGTGVPLPAAGCADGTPDVVTGIPTLAPVVCNADDTSGAQAAAPYGTRDALAVFLLDSGGSQLSKTATAQSESRAQAPPPQCSDGIDNDGDGKADSADPGCLSGPGGAYNPNDDNEADERRPQCSDTADNDGDGVSDAADPGCHTDGNAGNPASYDPNDDDETDGPKTVGGDPGDDDRGGDRRDRRRETSRRTSGGRPAPECSNGIDDDGDGVADRADPGCLSGPGGTYDPNDDSEADRRTELGALAMTGTDALLVALGGLLLLAAGLQVRRRTSERSVV